MPPSTRLSLSTLLVAGLAASASAAPNLDTAAIEQATGVKGTWNEKEGVFKLSVPRSDLKVDAGGVKMNPALGLTSWAAFARTGEHVMVMGDTVLLEGQVNPVMSVALDNGLEVTALHNHFFWENPRVMFLHIAGTGDEKRLAASVAKVWAKLKETSGGKGVVTRADIDPAKSALDPKKLDAILGYPGEYKGGVYKLTLGRETSLEGHTMGNAMGVNTWAAFAGTEQKAVVDGDFAMLESELQDVLKALRHANIDIVAIHQHMTGENPRIMFLHHWGFGRAEDLARGLKAAFAKTALARAN